MPFLVFDTETTGLPNFKLPADDPTQPRMAQISAALFDFRPGLTELVCVTMPIKPDGWAMPDELVEKLGHGLTTAYLAEHGRPVREALDAFMTMHERADLLCAYGIHFDQKILRGELRRAGLPDKYGEKETFCVMQAATRLCKIAPTDAMRAAGYRTNKTASLTEAVEILLGRKHEGAHEAEADMRATAEIYALVKDNPDAQPKAKVPTAPKSRPQGVSAPGKAPGPGDIF
jgi:DNA polymerase-3 subunit epsilon